MSNESLDEFLRRGGQITRCETVNQKHDRYSRYKCQDSTKQDGHAYRVDNYKKKSGGKYPPDHKMYMAFRKRMGVD